MENKLKACPICKTKMMMVNLPGDYLHPIEELSGVYCPLEGKGFIAKDWDSFIKLWNSRPSDVKMSEARARELTKEHGDEWTPVSESYPCGEMDVQTKVIADGHLHIEIAKLRKSGLFSNEIKVNGKLVREVTHWRFINTYPTEAHKTESELRAIIKQLREGLGSIRTAGIPYCDGGCVAQAKEVLERTKEE